MNKTEEEIELILNSTSEIWGFFFLFWDTAKHSWTKRELENQVQKKKVSNA